MIRVVIIEDEMLVRIGLKMCITEYDPQLKVVADFSSAEEALEYFEKNTADILVTDIRLNGMSGLELLHKLERKKPYLSAIILSCYEDFSYAKEAISLGVDSYVLKHEIDENEFPQLILNQYRKKCGNISTEAWHCMGEDRKEKERFGEAFQVASFVFRREGDRKNTTSEEIDFEILAEMFQKYLKDEELGECFVYRNMEICVLFSFSEKKDVKEGQEKIQRFWHEAASSVFNYFNRNAFMFLSEPYYALQETKTHYTKLLEEQDASFYCEKPACFRIETRKGQGLKAVPELKMPREHIFKDSWYQALKYEVNLFLKRCCTEGISAKEAKYRIIRLLNEMELYLEQNYKNLSFQSIFGEKPYLGCQDVETFDSAEQLCKELLKTAEMIVRYMQKQQEGFEAIEQYIRANYARQISLADMASNFHMNPVYFCQYFKKKKGITYVQFLNQVRMEEAKKLLQKGKLSVEQIAGMVGVENSNYFGRLFKKMTGMTVGEYRKSK